MTDEFTLEVVPLGAIRPHEEVDPDRVERLAARLEEAGVLVNPPIVTRASSGYVLLDGATRVEALRRLECRDAVVQVVDVADIDLRTWHHVVRGVSSKALRGEVEGVSSLELRPVAERGVARLYFSTGEPVSVHPVAGVSRFAALADLVHVYITSRRVSRATRPDPAAAFRLYPDMAALVAFSSLDLADVFAAADSGDRLPAGITRFVIPGRVLRLGVSVSLLGADLPAEEKQAVLARLLEERARDGRIRHYTEPVYILDE